MSKIRVVSCLCAWGRRWRPFSRLLPPPSAGLPRAPNPNSEGVGGGESRSPNGWEPTANAVKKHDCMTGQERVWLVSTAFRLVREGPMERRSKLRWRGRALCVCVQLR